MAAHGARLAALAAGRGLAVTGADGSERPIGISATPIVVEGAVLSARQRVAALVSSAGLKMARAMIEDPQLRPLVLDGLSPLERAFARSEPPGVLATTRVDFFEAAGVLKALEINATIPAMQGYSDIAAAAFLDVAGDLAGVSLATIEGWKARNGSNARALFDALRAGFRLVHPDREPTRIGILCRRHDAQLSELRFLAGRFTAFGIDAVVLHPDQLPPGIGPLVVDGRRIDLVYRHLFVRRLEEPGLIGAETVRALLASPSSRDVVVLNPPASQVEVKTVFGLLSQALEDEALAGRAGLVPAELKAITEAVPWTRLLRGDDLVAHVAARPDEVVLKRAWDYGGRTVLVGRMRHDPSFAERARGAWPELAAGDDVGADWPGLVARAATDLRGGGFVVQALVDARPVPHVLCGADGTRHADVYVDFSMYASVGIEGATPWGGVCRTSVQPIVNIVGGGGVAPVLLADVARDVEAALAAR